MKKDQDGYEYLNGDVKSQLMSLDLHKMLYKFRGESKVARSLMKINRLGYAQDSTRNITLQKDKSMTFCPKGKKNWMSKNSFNEWTGQNRQSAKYGKVIKKVVREQVPNLKFSTKDIEVAAQVRYCSEVGKRLTFWVPVPGVQGGAAFVAGEKGYVMTPGA